eukprot:3045205-Karenia_brevis.AAC.1
MTPAKGKHVHEIASIVCLSKYDSGIAPKQDSETNAYNHLLPPHDKMGTIKWFHHLQTAVVLMWGCRS